MARDPGSKWWPLVEAGAPDGYRKIQLIFHSTGDNSSADRIRGYFAQTGVVVESTFIIGKGPEDPTLQIMDSTDNADANYTANQRAISVEVVNDGNEPWTNWQVREAIRIGVWALANHPIDRRVCPAHDASGVGWHVMFGAPGPWTTVVGKVCPGAPAINQLRTIILPAIFSGDSEEDDMALYNGRDELRSDVYKATWVYPEWTTPDGSRKENPGQFLYQTRLAATQALALAQAAAAEKLTQKQIDAIVAGVTAALGDGVEFVLQPKG